MWGVRCGTFEPHFTAKLPTGEAKCRKKGYKLLKVVTLFVLPKGIEPLSKEPESFILSIELQELTILLYWSARLPILPCGSNFVAYYYIVRLHRNP